uniref:Uncharacterized protein n=1 Tax=Phytophthora ramorum TaxID=164328 RepID=H3GV50_PHYRM
MAASRLSFLVAIAASIAFAAAIPRQERLLQNKGATLEWPALRLHITIKQDSMKVNGQADFDMYANANVLEGNQKVLYDVYATFTEAKTLYNYTLVDGVGYSEGTPYTTSSSSGVPTPHVKCLDTESGKLPAINSIVAAINKATNSSANSTDPNTQCWTGNLYKTVMNGVDYTVCGSDVGFTMQSKDMDISAYYLESQIAIVAPTVDPKDKCQAKASASSVSPIGHSVLTGEPISSKRMLSADFQISLGDSPTCSCKSTPRPCIFIHGQGLTPEMPENQDSFPKYWGNLTDHAPCCSSMKYARLETINNGWTDEVLQQQVCDRALAVSDSSTKTTIADTIVVTHSMGNLMLAGAIANGKCKLDSSTTWVGLAGPMKGSMGSDFTQSSCAGETNTIAEKYGDITGKCPVKEAVVSLAYEGESYCSTELDAAYKAAQEVYMANVDALMCGEGYSGLLSSYQAQFWMLGVIVPHKSKKNDGMVEFDSCAVDFPYSDFGNTWHDRFYRTKLNHFDMQFLAGDSLLDMAKMPVKWFECLL